MFAPGHRRATLARVMVCSCCGGWRVEPALLHVAGLGPRWRYRVQTPSALIFVAFLPEVEAILLRDGKLHLMIDSKAEK